MKEGSERRKERKERKKGRKEEKKLPSSTLIVNLQRCLSVVLGVERESQNRVVALKKKRRRKRKQLQSDG